MHKALAGGPGIPNTEWCGTHDDYKVLVLDRLGLSLSDHLHKSEKKMVSLETVTLLADQLLTSIEHCHENDCIHRDIKPANILTGRSQDGNKILLIDFVLAKQYRYSDSKQHIANTKHNSVVGTAKYCSLWTHDGDGKWNALCIVGLRSHASAGQSRREDLISLDYTLVHLFRGNIQWSSERSDNSTRELKVLTGKRQLCGDSPIELQHHFEYVGALA